MFFILNIISDSKILWWFRSNTNIHSWKIVSTLIKVYDNEYALFIDIYFYEFY